MSKRRTHLMRILLGVVYFTALSLLVVWEYRDHLKQPSSDCQTIDQQGSPEESTFYARTYAHLLNWATADAATHVTVLAIPQDLEEIQSNLCLGRAYLADVLLAVANQNPNEIVIDKVFGPNACGSDPASTQRLQAVVRSLPMPVVIGESTATPEKRTYGVCLARKPQLKFDGRNVRHGLTRLNVELERLPLTWLVLPASEQTNNEPERSPNNEQGYPQFVDTLAWSSVQAADPAFAAHPSLQDLIKQDRHPYANLGKDLPRLNTTQLLCSAGDPATIQRWHLACTGSSNGAPAIPNLSGRIVMIGAENSSDRETVLERSLYGFDLHALYIEDLLSGSYLRSMPHWMQFCIFAFFIFLIEGLPTILAAIYPHLHKKRFLRHAYLRRRYAWVIFWAIIVILVNASISLAFRYLPPLAVYGDILLVAMTRILMFATESTEHPFIHEHSKGQSHVRSQKSTSAKA